MIINDLIIHGSECECHKHIPLNPNHTTSAQPIINRSYCIAQYSISCESESVILSVTFNSLLPHGLSSARLLSMEISRQEYWNGLPFPSPGDHLDPGIRSPALRAESLLSDPPGKPQDIGIDININIL